jgi:hypothetical protein
MYPVMMEDSLGNGSIGESPQSAVSRLASTVIGSPLSWWLFIILSLCVMERFELGVHSLPWNYWKRKDTAKNEYSRYNRDTDGTGSIYNHFQANGNCVRHVNGLSRPLVPLQFKQFIRLQLVPRFRNQCRNRDGRFAVLILSHMNSLRQTQGMEFRQITFDEKPLVDSSLTSYPEAYRLENYIAAQSTATEHPEVSIAQQIPALLAGFGRAERNYLRDPTPNTGILYCSEMPCTACTELLIDSLSGVCRRKTILAYSQDGPNNRKDNFQRLVNAGISVIKIRS